MHSPSRAGLYRDLVWFNLVCLVLCISDSARCGSKRFVFSKVCSVWLNTFSTSFLAVAEPSIETATVPTVPMVNVSLDHRKEDKNDSLYHLTGHPSLQRCLLPKTSAWCLVWSIIYSSSSGSHFFAFVPLCLKKPYIFSREVHLSSPELSASLSEETTVVLTRQHMTVL